MNGVIPKFSKWVWIFIVSFVFTVNSPAQSDTITTNSLEVIDRENILSTYKGLFILHDEAHYSISEISDSSFQHHFLAFNSNYIIQKGQNYWLKFSFINKTKNDLHQEQYHLAFKAPYTYETFELFYKENTNEAFKLIEGGAFSKEWFQRKNEHPDWFDKSDIIDLPITKNKISTYYIHIKSKVDIPFESVKLILYNHVDFKEKNKGKSELFYTFNGVVLMVIVFAIGMFFFTFDISFLYFSFSLLFTLIATLSTFHIIPPSLLDSITNYPEYELSLRLGTYFASASFFMMLSSFLNLKQLHPAWNTIFRLIALSYLLLLFYEIYLIIEGATFPYVWHDAQEYRFSSFTVAIAIIFTFFLPKLIKMKLKSKYFLLAGFASLIIAHVIIELSKTIYNTPSNESYPIFMVFGFIYLICFTLGFAYRMKENEIEKSRKILELQKIESEQQKIKLEKKRLEEINALKTKLYTNISHEFRTPLTVIQGMNGEIRGNKEIKKTIHRNAQQLLDFVNELLSLSKLESERYKPELIQMDVIGFLSEINDSFQVLAKGKNISLTFETSITQLLMDMDPQMFQKIITNLLNNALKYTEEGGNISMKASSRNEQLKIEIIDTGIGISPESTSFIFERFYQENQSYLKEEGIGVGLSLVKEFTQLLEGKIKVESKKGEGSIFTLLFPIKQNAALQDVQTIKNPDAILHQKSSLLGVKSYTSEKPIVLIVEDNKDVCKYLQMCLADQYSLHFTFNGKEGLDKAFEISPDFIISDIMMPEMDGYELCEKLKKDKRTSHIPIIILTARADDASRISGLRKGIDAYLMKPFSKEELNIRIQKILERRKHLQAYYTSDIQETEPIPEYNQEDDFIKELNEVILSNLTNEQFGQEELFRKIGMSKSNLHRKLKSLTGKSIGRYVRSIRLTKAKELLESTNMSVSQTGFEVGFNDLSYFTRSFKEEFGFTPSKTPK